MIGQPPPRALDRERLSLAIFAPDEISGPGGGNGRFLRGVRAELLARGHEVRLHAPQEPLDPRRALEGVDVVLVHDATSPELVRRLRLHHAAGDDHVLLFYDSHRREASAPPELRRFNLAGFDGVLTICEAVRRSYLERGWDERAWSWHEAADTDAFMPHPGATRTADLVWIGDGRDLGCSQQLGRLVLEPARRLRLSGVVHGEHHRWRARIAIQRSGLRYGGSLAEHLVPAVWARHRLTVALPPPLHSPPGVPPARLFEALACGIPLICAPWDDADGLFTAGRDYLLARDQREIEAAMRTLRGDRAKAAELAAHARATVLARHTCAQRADELLAIVGSLTARSTQGASVLAAPARGQLYGFPRKSAQNVAGSDYGSDRAIRAG
jgi:spore maturation protein CgeB